MERNKQLYCEFMEFTDQKWKKVNFPNKHDVQQYYPGQKALSCSSVYSR